MPHRRELKENDRKKGGEKADGMAFRGTVKQNS
jgi:hypothetical protein